MSVINDVRKLAQLLLRKGRIDRAGYERILANLAEPEKPASKQSKGSAPNRQLKQGDGEAVRLISSLRLKIPGAGAVLGEEDIVKAVAEVYGLAYRKLDPLELDMETVTRAIPKPFALKHMVLPLFERDGELSVAILDPENTETIDGVARATGKAIKAYLATPSDITKIIHEFYGFKDSLVKAEEQMRSKAVDLGNLEQLNRIKRPDQIQSDDEHIKNAVEYLFNYAFDQRASDIHIEPKRETSVIRFRIDGALNDVYSIPKGVHPAMVSRIKMLARMNITEKRKPQDGRIRVEHGAGTSELRVSSMPSAFGEKLVLRVLQPELLLRDMDTLGLFPEELIRVETFLNQPHGVILVTGPTGSGKTTTLYSALNFLSSPDKNIVTIEDPIETICENFNQTAVQPGIGLTFAAALRAILRQDPDIIMIGEIRDQETAENAMQAALTGHLVLSTLHTNDTASSITRLRDLGIKPYMINAGVLGIIAQRLVRVVCPHCAKTVDTPSTKLKQYGITISQEKVPLKEAKGCEECRFTGYYGRMGVYEVMDMDDHVRQMTQEGQSANAIRKYALGHGMTALRENAVRAMINGVTTLAEVIQLGRYL
ncbi:MAG: Flp pilus assembly complex ATPase component TadA [Nitrospinae bacterium]|nr:Flp pilus assembly complex ATPase component TadA [Nitrospinota bacterium]